MLKRLLSTIPYGIAFAFLISGCASRQEPLLASNETHYAPEVKAQPMPQEGGVKVGGYGENDNLPAQWPNSNVEPKPSPVQPTRVYRQRPSAAPTHYPYPTALPDYSPYSGASSLEDRSDDLSYEIRKLRRNSSEYDADEFQRRMKKLELEAESIAEEARSRDLGDSGMDDVSYDLGRIRRGVSIDPESYYQEREYDLQRKLRRVEGDADAFEISEE